MVARAETLAEVRGIGEECGKEGVEKGCMEGIRQVRTKLYIITPRTEVYQVILMQQNKRNIEISTSLNVRAFCLCFSTKFRVLCH